MAMTEKQFKELPKREKLKIVINVIKAYDQDLPVRKIVDELELQQELVFDILRKLLDVRELEPNAVLENI